MSVGGDRETIIAMEDTDAAAIYATLMRQPRSGSGGLVFTLIIACSAKDYAEALEAAIGAGREHPIRILVAVREKDKTIDRLDAEIRFDDDVPGNIVTLRMSGAVNSHPASVLVPLALPDLPVVVWWPGASPRDCARDEIGQLGSRRITDVAGAHQPLRAVLERARCHQPGATDLSWARITSWRALLVSALDQVRQPVIAAEVQAGSRSVPAYMMAAWLESRLCFSVPLVREEIIGTIRITLTLADGSSVVLSHSGEEACLDIPGQPTRVVALPFRSRNQLLQEELARLHSDPVFDTVVKVLLERFEREGKIS